MYYIMFDYDKHSMKNCKDKLTFPLFSISFSRQRVLLHAFNIENALDEFVTLERNWKKT